MRPPEEGLDASSGSQIARQGEAGEGWTPIQSLPASMLCVLSTTLAVGKRYKNFVAPFLVKIKQTYQPCMQTKNNSC